MENLIIGTAGHIDHGKTSLVRALTGIDTDRLLEEKRRGITIDIGFAHLQLGNHRLGFIDVPGHERFVKNMLAGIGGIDLLLMVVAADESVMPQTVEHFRICQLLGIPRGIIAITKRDLVDEEMALLVEEELRDLTRGSFLEQAPAVAVDSLSGRGIEQLKACIEEEIGKLSPALRGKQRQSRIFRMPVDRVFSVRGFGTVVTGTVLSGTLQREASLALYPSGKTAKVRGIEIFNQTSLTAQAGQRTALNLTGLDKENIERGMELSLPGILRATQMLDVHISVLSEAPGPLRHRAPIRFHHGSGEFMGRIHWIGKSQIERGASGFGQIRLEEPTLAFPGDRFVVRRYSPLTTVGGGIVLDNSPAKHRSRDFGSLTAKLESLLQTIRSDSGDRLPRQIEVLVAESGASGIELQQLVARTGFSPDSVRQALESLDRKVLVLQDPLLALDRSALEGIRRKITELVVRFHQEQPLAAGISKEELKRRTLPSGAPALFQFVLADLEARAGIETFGALVRLRSVTRTLDSEQEEARNLILALVESREFQPPTIDEVVQAVPGKTPLLKTVCFFLIEREELLRIPGEMVILGKTMDQIKSILTERYPAGRDFTVPDFKDLLNVSRKYAIPLLEYLDRTRFTRRRGDNRTLVD